MDYNSENDTESTGSLEFTPVSLGYVEKSEAWRLRSEFFRSKVGGKPAWLSLSDIPTNEETKCSKCNGPCIFLCQLYAPIEDRDSCFHRTIFVFMCPSVDCCQRNDGSNFKVFRSQLTRNNPFYSHDPPLEAEDHGPKVALESLAKICNVCNLKGTFHCGKCRRVNYCSREHQVADWKAGHKANCCSDADLVYPAPLLLPEWELVTEPEPDAKGPRKPEKSNDERLQEFHNLVQAGQAGTLHGDPEAEAELAAMPEAKEDITFKNFKQRIDRSPSQVVRYQREGEREPLWVSDQNQPGPVPPCKLCASPRTFEFQILPQMLNYLGLDTVGQSIDWGTLVVFTCDKSCDNGPAYKEEVLIKQDFSLNNIEMT